MDVPAMKSGGKLKYCSNFVPNDKFREINIDLIWESDILVKSSIVKVLCGVETLLLINCINLKVENIMEKRSSYVGTNR
jgi:hypothetical protein